jgi:hypothetical protein
MSDIVEKLRATTDGATVNPDGLEAAAYIEIVVDDLNKFRNGEYFLTLNDHIRQQETEIRSMQDTNERLRAALSTIANTRVSSWIGDIHGDTQDEWRDGLDQAISIARATLAEEKKDDR